jgi:hypothetical protein
MVELLVDEKRGTVVVGTHTVEGWVRPDTPCSKCGHASVHDETFDAAFCPACDRWMEAQCPDTACQYCSQRPDPPLAGRR